MVALTRFLRSKSFLAIYLVLLSLIVFTPATDDSSSLLFIFRFRGAIERILNIFLLVPLPFLLLRNFPNLRVINLILIGVLTPMLIEVVQRYIPGRFSDPIDFLINLSGYLISLYLVIVFNKKLTTHRC